MHLNHLNLCASDVPRLAARMEKHLGYRILQVGTVPDVAGVDQVGGDFAMLLGGDGSFVVISQIDPPADGTSAYPRQFHVGLLQDTEAEVYAKHAELRAAGFAPGEISAGFSVLGATWTAFYCEIGDGLEVEINCRTYSEVLDSVPARPPDAAG